jgi:hypothetical protein
VLVKEVLMRFTWGALALACFVLAGMSLALMLVLDDGDMMPKAAPAPRPATVADMALEAMQQARQTHELRCIEVKEPVEASGSYCIDWQEQRTGGHR